MIKLTELEKKVIASIQGDIPITERPFLEIAKTLGVSEDTFLAALKGLSDKDIIRRFGVTIRHQKSGFQANAMVAWEVDEEQAETVGEKMASFREVSHCYRRNPTGEWPYSLYTMIHAQDEDSCREIARKISAEASVEHYALLFSRKELKKTSMQYFSSSPGSE